MNVSTDVRLILKLRIFQEPESIDLAYEWVIRVLEVPMIQESGTMSHGELKIIFHVTTFYEYYGFYDLRFFSLFSTKLKWNLIKR